MSKFSVTLKIGGNWTNGMTYIQQATIIADGRTLKEVEEKAISMYCEDIIKQYGETNNLEAIYNNIDKTTEATCSTCDKCVCEWSITARARRMKKDESYTYARNYSGVRYCYNGFYKGYTTKNICYIAYDPEYNKAQTTEATEITETQTTEATEITETQTTEATEITETQTTEAIAETTEATAETTEETAQPDTAERGPIMKKYNIKVTACGVELNTLSNIPTSFTINKSFIIEAKDKEDAKQKGREKFIAETLYKGSIYGEYTGERRIAPFMEGFAGDHSGKYEDITRRDYFEYSWHINVFVKQYRKPRTKPEAEATAQIAETTEEIAETTEATAQTTEATAQPKAEETTEQPKAEEATQPTETETTEATAETTEATAETTEATAETEYDYNASYPTTEETTQTTETTLYPNKAMLNSYYGMCVTAPPPTETTEQPKAEEATQPTETTAETPETTTQPTEAKTTAPPTEETAQTTETTQPIYGPLITKNITFSDAFHRATKSTPPPPIISTGKEVTGVTIREHRQYNNGIEKIIVHKGFYNFDELISWYQHNDPSFLCTYKGILFGCDNIDYYAASFIYESEYL